MKSTENLLALSLRLVKGAIMEPCGTLVHMLAVTLKSSANARPIGMVSRGTSNRCPIMVLMMP